MFKGRKILLGITGSIAAYKSILLTRLLVVAGAEVKVILTPAAKDFVSPLTLATLSRNKVLVQLADEDTWANHVMLGRWADVMVIAPASCNTLSKMAHGVSDNLLMASFLSATCPVAIAPAMDEDMWLHPATMKNVECLREFGHTIIPVNKGELGSGLYGEGRMAEPADIVTFLSEKFFREKTLNGKKAIVTAGPTHEAIDPVRFIGNRSSGKMGIAIAEELYMMGAEVVLVTGPISASVSYRGIKVIPVNTAAEMFEQCQAVFAGFDIAVMAAAVADYRPETVATEKIKKKDAKLSLQLTKTVDILQTLGSQKKSKQVLVGFALETENETDNAIAKLEKKNADFIVLNSLTDPAVGFGKDTNKVTIFGKDKRVFEFEAKSKALVAKDIVEIIIKDLNEKI